MSGPRGRKSRPTSASSTELFPELCDPTTAICGSSKSAMPPLACAEDWSTTPACEKMSWRRLMSGTRPSPRVCACCAGPGMATRWGSGGGGEGCVRGGVPSRARVRAGGRAGGRRARGNADARVVAFVPPSRFFSATAVIRILCCGQVSDPEFKAGYGFEPLVQQLRAGPLDAPHRHTYTYTPTTHHARARHGSHEHRRQGRQVRGRPRGAPRVSNVSPRAASIDPIDRARPPPLSSRPRDLNPPPPPPPPPPRSPPPPQDYFHYAMIPAIIIVGMHTTPRPGLAALLTPV